MGKGAVMSYGALEARFKRAERRVRELADEAFDPELDTDDDGTGQTARDSLLEALDIFREELFREGGRRAE